MTRRRRRPPSGERPAARAGAALAACCVAAALPRAAVAIRDADAAASLGGALDAGAEAAFSHGRVSRHSWPPIGLLYDSLNLAATLSDRSEHTAARSALEGAQLSGKVNSDLQLVLGLRRGVLESRLGLEVEEGCFRSGRNCSDEEALRGIRLRKLEEADPDEGCLADLKLIVRDVLVVEAVLQRKSALLRQSMQQHWDLTLDELVAHPEAVVEAYPGERCVGEPLLEEGASSPQCLHLASAGASPTQVPRACARHCLGDPACDGFAVEAEISRCCFYEEITGLEDDDSGVTCVLSQAIRFQKLVPEEVGDWLVEGGFQDKYARHAVHQNVTGLLLTTLAMPQLKELFADTDGGVNMSTVEARRLFLAIEDALAMGTGCREAGAESGAPLLCASLGERTRRLRDAALLSLQPDVFDPTWIAQVAHLTAEEMFGSRWLRSAVVKLREALAFADEAGQTAGNIFALAQFYVAPAVGGAVGAFAAVVQLMTSVQDRMWGDCEAVVKVFMDRRLVHFWRGVSQHLHDARDGGAAAGGGG